MELKLLLSILLLYFDLKKRMFVRSDAATANSDCVDLYEPGTKMAFLGQESSSHQCFLDCTRDTAITMACEDVDFVTFLDSANRVPLTGKMLYVNFWNSPKLTEVDVTVFVKNKFKLTGLRLMNLPNLINFPTLQEHTTLKEFSIEHAPNLHTFSPETLPPNLERLVLYETGITSMTVDTQETKQFKHLAELIITLQNIDAVGKNFFSVFPNLKSAKFMLNRFNLQSLRRNSFDLAQPVETFVFYGNNFTNSLEEVQNDVLGVLLDGLRLVPAASVDLSYNNLRISRSTVNSFAAINGTYALSLAGNNFGQFISLENIFINFTRLRRLDLSYTDLPQQKGLFGGLDQLKFLQLSGNKLRDLNINDIFYGCNAKLSTLDLSNNLMSRLPTGWFRNLTSNLTTLILSGNMFHSDLAESEASHLSPLPAEFDFRAVRDLDLSRSNLYKFRGAWVKNLTNLQTLDLSCNKFTNISKDFFEDLPTTLQVLNLSFCVKGLSDSPNIEQDAFAGLGSKFTKSIKDLILSNSYLKGWIFFRLHQMNNNTRAGLNSLDLSNNRIYYLETQQLAGLPELKKLNLAGNFIQNVGKNTFSATKSLGHLNLSRNKILSIHRDEFAGLNALTYLDLSYNNLIIIDPFSFDNMPLLQNLYLGRNFKLKSINKIFVKGGKRLVHLGLQGLQYVTLLVYPGGCLNRTDLDPLQKLQYFYIDNATATFVDHGDQTGSLRDKIKGTEVIPADPEHLGCLYGTPQEKSAKFLRFAIPVDPEPNKIGEWTDDFLRLVIKNPNDLSPRTFVANIPKCYSRNVKGIAMSTTNFLCPYFDPKTYIKGRDNQKPADN